MNKIAFSRLDLLLVALLIACGLGISLAAEQCIQHWTEKDEPQDEKFQKENKIPLLNARLAITQANLTAGRTRVADLRQERLRDAVALDAHRRVFPSVTRAEQILFMRPDILQAFAQARLDHAAANRLTQALEMDLAALVAEANAPTPAKTETAAAALFQARVAVARERLAATQKALTDARLDRARAGARVAAFESCYPILSQVPADGLGLVVLPADIHQNLGAAAQRLAAADNLWKQWIDDLATTTEATATAESALAEARRKAADDLDEARKDWRFGRWWKTLAVSLGGLALLFLVTLFLCKQIRHAYPRVQDRLVLAVAFPILFVLYAYQAAGFPGAAGIGALALVGLAFLAVPTAGAAPGAGGGA